MNSELLLELVIRTDWQRIDNVRQAIAHCVVAAFGDVELKDSLSMVSAELLENAFKYGLSNQGVTLSIRLDAEDVILTVSNAIEPGSRHVFSLLGRLAWLRQFSDPLAAYTAALQQVYEGSGPGPTDSGLGVVRIHYEGHCRLHCDTSQPGRISVSAKCRRPIAGGPEVS